MLKMVRRDASSSHESRQSDASATSRLSTKLTSKVKRVVHKFEKLGKKLKTKNQLVQPAATLAYTAEGPLSALKSNTPIRVAIFAHDGSADTRACTVITTDTNAVKLAGTQTYNTVTANNTAVESAVAQAKPALTIVTNAVKSADTEAKTAIATVINAVESADTETKTAIATVTNAVKSADTEARTAITTVTNAVKSADTEAKTAIATVTNAVKSADTEAKIAIATITNAVKSADTEAKIAIATITNAVKSADTEAKIAIATITNAVKSADAEAKTAIAIVTNAVKSADTEAKTAIATVTNAVKSAGAQAKTAITSAANGVKPTDTQTKTALTTGTNTIEPAIVDTEIFSVVKQRKTMFSRLARKSIDATAQFKPNFTYRRPSLLKFNKSKFDDLVRKFTPREPLPKWGVLGDGDIRGIYYPETYFPGYRRGPATMEEIIRGLSSLGIRTRSQLSVLGYIPRPTRTANGSPLVWGDSYTDLEHAASSTADESSRPLSPSPRFDSFALLHGESDDDVFGTFALPSGESDDRHDDLYDATPRVTVTKAFALPSGESDDLPGGPPITAFKRLSSDDDDARAPGPYTPVPSPRQGKSLTEKKRNQRRNRGYPRSWLDFDLAPPKFSLGETPEKDSGGDEDEWWYYLDEAAPAAPISPAASASPAASVPASSPRPTYDRPSAALSFYEDEETSPYSPAASVPASSPRRTYDRPSAALSFYEDEETSPSSSCASPSPPADCTLHSPQPVSCREVDKMRALAELWL